MLEEKKIALVALILALLVASAGCIGNSFEEEQSTKKKLELELMGSDITVARGDNVTFVVLVKNHLEKTYNSTIMADKLPKGFTIEMFITTFELMKFRQKATLARLFIGEEADLGQSSFWMKSKFLEKTSIKSKKKVRVKVVAPGQGDTRNGDSVDVDYIGFLDNGEIFDTSVADIGRNSNIPKSKEWQGHGDTYKPMNVILDTGGVVSGFNDGIKGLSIGQSRTIMVPPEEGYAQLQDVTINKTEKIEMVGKMEWNSFVQEFGETPAENKVVRDKYWGWSVQVIDLEGTNVTIMINPQDLLNKTIRPYGWDSKVVSIDSLANGGKGEIIIEHKPSTAENVTFRGKPGTIKMETDKDVTISYNLSQNPLAIVNMWFHITLISIN